MGVRHNTAAPLATLLGPVPEPWHSEKKQEAVMKQLDPKWRGAAGQMRSILAAGVVTAAAVVMAATSVVASEPTTWVVDDDGLECANADFPTIGEAVAAASPGDTIRACAGVYRERIDVTKQLRLIGQNDAVEAVDCFDQTWSTAAAVDPTVFPVLEPPDPLIGSLVRLQAHGIELAGFVVQGQREPTPLDKTVFAPAIQADGAYAGHWIHHNLIQDNTFGVELGSSGSTPSRVDHNCLRGNDWALANQRYTTAEVRVDHNNAFRTRVIPFEVGTYAGGISDARFDHNRSVGSGFAAYLVEKATRVQLEHNTIEGPGPSGNGIFVRGDNRDVAITNNQLSGSALAGTGISLSAPVPQAPAPSAGILIATNTVERFNLGILVANNARTTDTRVLENITLANRVSGIQIGPTNTSALVQANVSDRNRFGIRTASSLVTGNSFVGNSMHENSEFDAVESSFTTTGGVIDTNNVWQANVCDTDSPAGTICGH